MRSVEATSLPGSISIVETDDEMITDRTKTTLTMPAVDVGSGKILSRTSGGTVDDDRVFHGRILLSCLQTAGEITPERNSPPLWTVGGNIALLLNGAPERREHPSAALSFD